MFKKQAILIFILCFFSLFSVGFASWNIENEFTDENNSVTISSADVIDFNNYVTILSTKSLKYTKNGFINDLDNRDEDYIEFKLKLNLNECRDNLGNDETVKFKFSLLYNNFTANQNFDILSCVTSKVTLNGTAVADSSNNNIEITINLAENNNDYIEIYVNYYFKVNMDYFTNSLSPLVTLNNSNIFILNSSLSINADEGGN